MDTLNFAYKDCDYFSFILVLNKKPPDFRENPGVEFKHHGAEPLFDCDALGNVILPRASRSAKSEIYLSSEGVDDEEGDILKLQNKGNMKIKMVAHDSTTGSPSPSLKFETSCREIVFRGAHTVSTAVWNNLKARVSMGAKQGEKRKMLGSFGACQGS